MSLKGVTHVFRGTSVDNARSIAEEGLRTHRPWYGTDQGSWPDGSTKRRSYFHLEERGVESFYPEGKPATLRVKLQEGHPFQVESGTGDVYSSKRIHPKHIEIKQGGAWKPIATAFDIKKLEVAIRGSLNEQRREVDRAANRAATSVKNSASFPTRQQQIRGQYRKGAFQLHGLDIRIENPIGSIRLGPTHGEGRAWARVIRGGHYGYIQAADGRVVQKDKDGDYPDVFVGPNPTSKTVFIVNQMHHKHRNKFDEHKIILGANGREEAESIYMANYPPSWHGMGGIKRMSLPQFKSWLWRGSLDKPV